MSRSNMRSFAGSALLLLAAASPSLAVTLSVLPAQPVEQTPFTLVIGGTASCPSLDTLKVQPNRVVLVRLLLDQCPTLPQPFLLEIPIPPLGQGIWSFQVLSGDRQLEGLTVHVQPEPFRLDLDPPSPQAGSPFSVLLTGSGSCSGVGNKLERDGNLLTLWYYDSCQIEFIPPPEPFVIELAAEPLPAGDYVVQAIDADGVLASRRFHVSGPAACTVSETALCLLQGRYRVEATWRTATAQGVARAHPESDNFGAFSLADPDRLELFIGLLDACATQYQMVWVYTSGLTDAEIDFTVTEVATGEVRGYPNQLGMPFVPMLDTMAFVCPPPPGS